MDPAIPTRIDAIADGFVGMKLRVAGQVLAYDAYTGLVILRARGAAVALDVADCVSAWPARDREWLGEHLCTVTAVAYLERAPPELRVPALPRYVPAPRIVDGLVLRALLVAARTDLDLGLWQAGIEANNGEQ
ncbi:hypothetical protein GGX14DRAFT_318098, partial [Mycena pura]